MTSAFTGNKALPEIGMKYVTDFPAAILRYAGTATEQRATRQNLSYRRYAWAMKKTDAERIAIESFLLTQNWKVTAFYVRDPKDHARTSVSLGTSVSGQTNFALPSSGENLRDYPISTATVTVYDDAVATTTTVTVHTDGRTVGLSTAPTSGSVMTVDYHYYRLVRLNAEPEWTMLAPNYFETVLDLWEVPA